MELTDKYTLDPNDKIFVGGRSLCRIIAKQTLRTMGGIVYAGEKGGYIETMENLSQIGTCWVDENAKVYEKAAVRGSARISGHAEVYGNATVGGDALITGCAKVFGKAHIRDRAIVRGDASVSGGAFIVGDAQICGSCEIKHPYAITTGVYNYLHSEEIDAVQNIHLIKKARL